MGWRLWPAPCPPPRATNIWLVLLRLRRVWMAYVWSSDLVPACLSQVGVLVALHPPVNSNMRACMSWTVCFKWVICKTTLHGIRRIAMVLIIRRRIQIGHIACFVASVALPALPVAVLRGHRALSLCSHCALPRSALCPSRRARLRSAAHGGLRALRCSRGAHKMSWISCQRRSVTLIGANASSQ